MRRKPSEDVYWRALLEELLAVIGDGGEAMAETSVGVTAAMAVTHPAEPGETGDAAAVALTVRPNASGARASTARAVDNRVGRIVAAMLVDTLGTPRELHAGFCEAGAFHVSVTVDRTALLAATRGAA